MDFVVAFVVLGFPVMAYLLLFMERRAVPPRVEEESVRRAA